MFSVKWLNIRVNMERTMNAESKIYFLFKIYTKVIFKRDSLYTYFNESKIVTSSQKGGKKINFTKNRYCVHRKNLIFSLKMDFIFGFISKKVYLLKWYLLTCTKISVDQCLFNIFQKVAIGRFCNSPELIIFIMSLRYFQEVIHW